MASLGRITNSALSGVNENTFTLANLNFDFSLVTFQAPAEYSALGKALAPDRRQNAQYGKTHQIARKLGALFERLVPESPRLFKAYGKRASEIMAAPGVNPLGTERHGPFAPFVGADASSIWAAATSGDASIAMHLLACLLARSFDSRGSTSVWAELVTERKREIERGIESNFISPMTLADANAASQEISRDELRQWDASARAWILCADGAKRKERTQMLLILKNIGVPMAVGLSTYDGVIHAWRQAMLGLSRLLNGEPQSVTDGTILLALSAWHLYPDLIVLGSTTTNVRFNDPLMHPAGLITVGLTIANVDTEGGEGVRWSLALSHYRYYGDPVKIIGSEQNRLTIQQLHLVSLGSLLGIWNVPRGNPFPAANWFVALWNCILHANPAMNEPHWLQILAITADSLLKSTGEEREVSCALLDFGQRRGKSLLWQPSSSVQSQEPLPWFGLRTPHVFSTLSRPNNFEGGIQYLREIANAGNLKCADAVITVLATSKPRSRQDEADKKRVSVHAYAAVAPHSRLFSAEKEELPPENMPEFDADDADDDDDIDENKSRLRTSSFKKSEKSANSRSKDAIKFNINQTYDRWLNHANEPAINSQYTAPSDPATLSSGNNIHEYSRTDDPADDPEVGNFMQEEFSGSITPQVSDDHKHYLSYESSFKVYSSKRHLSALPESCLSTCDAVWYHAPLVFFLDSNKTCELSCPCLEETQSNAPFNMVFNSTQDTFRLWIRSTESFRASDFEHKVQGLHKETSQSLLKLEAVIEALENGFLDGANLLQYLDGSDPLEEDEFAKPLLELMRIERSKSESLIRSLRNLAFATDIYNCLEGATISSSVVENNLAEAKWGAGRDRSYVTRAMVFACIAMLESGYVNLDPNSLDGVMALSSGNSIFVASCLLNDPAKILREHSITRIVGNVGRPGISLMIPPAENPRVRPLSSSFRAVSYAPFDCKRENNFGGTSLHLSFTKFEFPLKDGTLGTMDQQIFLVETVVSVYDRGEWVADLNILKMLDKKMNMTLAGSRFEHDQSQCVQSSASEYALTTRFTSIDSWEEILDTPPSIGVIRCNNNWSARIAAVTLLAQTHMKQTWESEESEGGMSGDEGKFCIIENCTEVCWKCLYRKLPRHVRRQVNSFYYLID